MIIDHVTVFVSDYARARAFYDLALAPLGIVPCKEYGTACGYGRGGKPELWIAAGRASFHDDAQAGKIVPTHVALSAADEAAVEAFHAAALAAGGRDFGAPGCRAHYHPGYYGAFVLDPDGNNVEAVIHHHGAGRG